VLAPDGRRVVVRVELPADVERPGRLLELPEVAEPAREVEEDLDLHAAPPLALLGRGVLPDLPRTDERFDGLRGRWSFSRQ
jgi:hypothetical protein